LWHGVKLTADDINEHPVYALRERILNLSLMVAYEQSPKKRYFPTVNYKQLMKVA
jgi:hypothetical protein